MRIAVDAMGGDSGVGVVVTGVVRFLRENPDNVEVVLVGDSKRIEEELKRQDDLPRRPLIEHATEEVEMNEHAASSLRRKRDSSIGRGILLQKNGEASAFVSAGNTGAVVATSLLTLGRLPGVRRPAIANIIPDKKNGFVLLDIGATKECRPGDLAQFAHMGAVFAERILKRDNPKVGLLNIGEEETKGNDLVKEAYSLLKKSRLNFTGNVEAGRIFRGDVDVAVCDGFVGNVILKVAEGLVELIMGYFRDEIDNHFLAKTGALLLKPTFKHMKSQFSYEQYGGAILLGVDGTCIICHGRSSPLAIANAIRSAARFVKYDINREIRERLDSYEEVSVE